MTNSTLVKQPIDWFDITPIEPDKKWLWENYIARGHITLLSALWKSGKSTFIRCLLKSMCENTEFCGEPTTRANVLVLSEESDDEWWEAKEDFSITKKENIFILPRAIIKKPNKKEWEDLVLEIQSFCILHEISLVIIDTIATFMPIQNENDAGEWSDPLTHLYKLTESEIKTAVLLVHHSRKSGGEESTAIRGSGALPSFVSSIIEFRRLKGNESSAQRQLISNGRFSQVNPEIIINFNPDTFTYIVLGNKWEVSRKAKHDALLELFKKNNFPLTISDIITLWNKGNPPTRRTIQRQIKEMISAHALRESTSSSSIPSYEIDTNEIPF